MRVLIADDSDLLVKRLLAELARVNGLEIVATVGTAAEASEAIRRLKPEAVILDLCMPGGSGMDVLKQIKRDQLGSVVIVLTGHGESQYRKKCLESGATFFFDKSADFEMVAEVLRSLLPRELKPGGARGEQTGHEIEDPENPLSTLGSSGATSQPKGSATDEKPRLLVSNSEKGEPIYYMCSHCLRGFPIPGVQPPKQAMRELYDSFREHVDRTHPESTESDLRETVK